jgi:hypothetical protein
MKLLDRKVPAKVTRAGSLWAYVVDTDMLRTMRSNPGHAFQLADDAGRPLVLPVARTAALSKACPRPYRIQTRTADDSKSHRHVWISFDPAYWQNKPTKGTKK